MKTLVMLALLAIPAALMAAGPAVVPENMMQAMQKVQECMAQIDQSQIQEMEHRSARMEGEIDQLCAAGKRDKAQELAMKYVKEIESLPAVKQMQKCSELVADIMPMTEDLAVIDEDDDDQGHVCD